MKKIILFALLLLSIATTAQNKASDTLYYLPCTNGRVVTLHDIDELHESDDIISFKSNLNELVIIYCNNTPKDYHYYIIYIVDTYTNKAVKSRLIKVINTYMEEIDD